MRVVKLKIIGMRFGFGKILKLIRQDSIFNLGLVFFAAVVGFTAVNYLYILKRYAKLIQKQRPYHVV